MKHLFLVRHGQYDAQSDREPLTEVGRKQINSIAIQIKEILNGLNPYSTYLASSKEQRAVESAEIIGKALGIQFPIKLSALQVNDRCISGPTLDFLIDNVFEDAIILIGHAELLQYGRRFCDMRNIAGNGFDACEKGEAIHIDLENKMSYALKPKIGKLK